MANECIPLYRPGADLTCLAGAAVTGKRMVMVSADTLNATTGALATVTHATAATRALGVAVADAASGDRVRVISSPGEIVPVAAAGTIAANADVEVGTAGKVVTIASGVAVGKAMQAGSNNNDILIKLY